MRLDPIHIVDWEPAWAVQFARQRDRLTSAIGPLLVVPIEHIGSTAVPGLAAKPIIDMVAVVEAIDTFDVAAGALTAIGWLSAPEPGDDETRRRSWCFPSVERRSHHLHVVEHASPHWPTWLAFRDHLSTHPDDRDRYADLKRSLAAADDTDRPRYRAAKAPLIAEILQRAGA